MKTSRNRRGIALAWTAIVLIVMIGIVGLSIDWGWVTLDAQKLQNAADAASLAGALKVKSAFHDGVLDSVYGRAQALSRANHAAGASVDVHFNAATNDPTLDVVIGRWFASAPDDPTTAEDDRFDPFDSADPTQSPNAVKVVTRHVTGWSVNQPLALNFGPMFSTPTANVKREAIAIAAGGGGAALVCLDPSRLTGLEVSGTTVLNVMAGPVPGEIYVNSSNSEEAVNVESSSAPNSREGWAIECAGLSVYGAADPIIEEYYEDKDSTVEHHYSVLDNLHAVMPDPLAWVPDLGVSTLPRGVLQKTDATGTIIATHNVNQVITDAVVNDFGVAEVDGSGNPVLDPITGKQYWTVTIDAGYWPGGIQLNGTTGGYTTKVKLNPGIFAFGGGPKATGTREFVDGAWVASGASGLDLSGGVVEGFGVMIYITKSDLDPTDPSSVCVWGKVSQHGGTGTLRVTQLTDPPSSPYAQAGLAIFQDRQNPSEAYIGGGAANNILGGTLYFHSNGWRTLLHLQGGSGESGIQVITDRLLVAGNATVTIAYDGRNFQPCNTVYLVK